MRDYNNTTRKRINFLALLILCFSFVVLMINTTIAWFTDESTTSNGGMDITLVGTLSLDVTTNFNFKNLALAPDKIYETDYLGQDIGTYIKTSLNHDISGAYVRIKFQTVRRNVGESQFIDNSDLFDLYFGEPDDTNLTTSTAFSDDELTNWYYNSSDDYYYYIGAVMDTNVTFNRGYKTTNRMTNVERDAEVRIFLTVESVQRQYGAYLEVWGNTVPTIFHEWAEVDEEARWGQANNN